MRNLRFLPWWVAFAAGGALAGCGLDVIGLGGPVPEIDQENRLDGPVADQGIGRFSDVDGSPDPSGTSYDLQAAQTFTAGVDGALVIVQLAILDPDGATQPVILELREVVFDPGTLSYAPSEDDSLAGVLGAVALPASGFATADPADPTTWPAFDVSFLGVELVAGTPYCVSVRTADTIGFRLPPELSSSYPGGAAWRRNRAVTSAWTQMLGADLGFRTYVAGR